MQKQCAKKKKSPKQELCFLMPEFQGKQDFVRRDFLNGISFGFFMFVQLV
jgi:hypothetical protein